MSVKDFAPLALPTYEVVLEQVKKLIAEKRLEPFADGSIRFDISRLQYPVLAPRQIRRRLADDLSALGWEKVRVHRESMGPIVDSPACITMRSKR